MNIEKISKKDKGLYVDAPRCRSREKEVFERTTVQLKAETMRRFNKKTNGGKAICLNALIEFAMDTLDERGEIIVISN